MSTATQAVIEAAPADIQSKQRMMRLKELWTRSQRDQLEIGRVLYEERAERLAAGGRGIYEGFHQWLRDTGIPKTSAYRRIAEYEISVGERTEDDKFDKPVPTGTTLNAGLVQVEHSATSREMAYQIDQPAPDSHRQCESPLDEGQRRLAEWGTIYPLKTPYTYAEHREWYKTFLKDYLKDGPMPKVAPVGNSAEAGAFTDARAPIVSGGLGVRTINGRWHLPHQVPACEPTATLKDPQEDVLRESEPMCSENEDEVVTLALRVIDAGFEALKDSIDPNHLHVAVQRAKQSLRKSTFSN